MILTAKKIKEGYKDHKIHSTIEVRLATDRPASQATTMSIGTLGSLPVNTIKHNPAIMSGIQLLILVFLAILLANLMSYLIEDFQSDDDLSAYLAWIYGEIVFNLFTLRIFVPILLISQKQGFRQFMRSAVLELASEFKEIGLQSSNTSRLLSATKSTTTTNLVRLEKTQGHKRPEEVLLYHPTLGLEAPTKNEVKTQDQEDVPTQKTVPLNTVNVELQETNDKPDLRNIKEEIETEPGMAQELLQSVDKGKGNGKGQSNFKKRKVMRQEHITDNEPIETKQEPECKKEKEKITKSALASRQALKKWRENTKQLQAGKIVEAKGQSNFKKGKVMRQKYTLDDKPVKINQEPECKEEEEKIPRSALASRQALKKWRERTKQLQTRKNIEAKT